MTQIITQYVVIALLVGAGLYLSLLCYFVFRQRRLVEQVAEASLSRFSAEVALLREKNHQQRIKNELAWNRFRKFRIARKESENSDICSIYLTPNDNRPLQSFLPGQYLTLKLNIPGNKQPVTRCYSLSDSCFRQDYYRLTIKRIPAPRDHPELSPGLSSNFLHDSLHPGDTIDLKAPSGNFYLDTDSEDPVVLIGGGVGITPVLSMLNTITQSGSKRETWFFYGVRNSDEHIMKGHLMKAAAEHENVHVVICYSDPKPEDMLGQDYHHGERVSVELMKSVLPHSDFDFYLCGPPPMMKSIVNDLQEGGINTKRIHFEAFGPASVKQVVEATSHPSDVQESHAFDIRFARSDKTVTWDKRFSSLLECAEENDIIMDSGCRAGNCGTCESVLIEGDIDYIQERGAECQKRGFLSCISIPRSNLVVDA